MSEPGARWDISIVGNSPTWHALPLERVERGFVAEMERLKIRERTQRGTRARVEAGKPLVGCRPPYGYRWRDAEKSGFLLDPERAAVVRRIFDSVLQGQSLRGTCRALMAAGFQRRVVGLLSGRRRYCTTSSPTRSMQVGQSHFAT